MAVWYARGELRLFMYPYHHPCPPSLKLSSHCMCTVLCSNATGTLLAYLGDGVRGAARASFTAAPFGPMKGKHSFEMLVFVSAEDSGKSVDFRFVPDEGVAIPLWGSVTAALDASHGNLLEPVLLRFMSSEEIERLNDRCKDLLEPGRCAAKQAMGLCAHEHGNMTRLCKATCGLC